MWYYESRIRIEPDWNVKLLSPHFLNTENFIRIEPDWNVKLLNLIVQRDLEID